jgi:hypothetical protein
VQACDDSTREDVKQRIDAKAAEMQQRGHHCLVTRRSVNKGFKAGNMINGMSFLNEVCVRLLLCNTTVRLLSCNTIGCVHATHA